MSDYCGYKELKISDAELSYIYSNADDNKYDCLVNEHLIIRNSDTNICYFRWDGHQYSSLVNKQINSEHAGKIKPRNPQQALAIDMLLNTDITIKVLAGVYGSGKDYFMSSAALELIKKGKYDRIVWVRNNIEVKNSKPIGHLPGTAFEKLLPYAMPLADHLGGTDGLSQFIRQGRVEIAHLGFIRGRDIKNSIIICSEAENMTKEHVKLLIGRVGEGSALWLNGDYRQVDHNVFENNNGLLTAIDKLKGHPRFGYVYLPTSERSETAAMADLLD